MNLTEGTFPKNVIETSPIGICIINAELFTVQMLSDRYAQIYGQNKNSILGTPVDQLITEGHNLEKKSIQDAAIHNKSITSSPVDLEVFIDGHLVNISITTIYSPVSDQNGKITEVAVWMIENKHSEDSKISNGNTLTDKKQDHSASLLYEIPSAVAILSGEELKFELLNPSYQNLVPDRELLGKPFFEAHPELAGSELDRSLKKST